MTEHLGYLNLPSTNIVMIRFVLSIEKEKIRSKVYRKELKNKMNLERKCINYVTNYRKLSKKMMKILTQMICYMKKIDLLSITDVIDRV